MKILECSSKGDKRFSAFYAYINLYGVNDSIEYHYQGCKRFYVQPTKIKGAMPDYYVQPTEIKGAMPDYIEINNIKYDLKYLTPFYKLLWVKYLDNHIELVEYAKQFDDFNDIFKGKSINCQADVIRQYIKYGRSNIMNEPLVREFINKVKETN